ncbi:hypothetical protein H7J87_28065 [Mycolicibacterium wolinskyi]|uniref:Uncharacterized protein n=1 Tax=Mycolicibacterium wolinskyi TaxID=59750 RepID=A0A1X2FDK2_9MYCO|nr:MULTISPECIES: hypothetical protein [Mycolicibacterium]MCV7289188.1 hypothetical protein [Mycolicibacterium wolinskyi]MCV7294215.1 hypothetical protein [Mycolicibacterium goodii]ORX16494.1 hypothetical protein AWC31_20860 [Mycolicibacterium wolinskyi]
MFERVKYMVGFAGAYRRSRSAGADHFDALDTAARDMMLRKLDGRDEPTADQTLPEPVAEIWRDPESTCALADGAWFGDGSIEITSRHIGLLRQMRFGWDGAERGAPMLDPKQPYGRTDLLAQLGEVFESDDARELARRHVEMFFVLARALRHGELSPGRYPLGNIGPDDVRRAMRGYPDVTDADLGLDADGQVTISDDHVRLLRAIDIRWPSEYDCEDLLAIGRYPAAAADPKRTYGDFSFIEVDMARVLDVLPPPPLDGPAVFEPSPELAARLQRLHWQMLVAMQVFVEHGNLAPGVYSLDG